MPTVVNRSKIVQELRELHVLERMNIVTDVWDEIKESKELEFVSDEEKRILLNRMANYRSNPGSAAEWSDLK